MSYRILITMLIFPCALSAFAANAGASRSGYDYLTPESRAMQDDDFENPGMVSVEQGAALFRTPGKNG